ncbi:GNAT family N-acetyltransferase [Paenibacillus harenae]|uniref:Ribosomal protein S18 acetylase RimI-like enzyme n=1 Tax=Paenibacillus harenae TaxID=306543 RepID=A0ABT9TYC6_PAEHA|nr:GNAT family N-acetyltransferase [Paenibacillus harenae]MDQ0112369.1 ribosomal protein S18 acetylase RimI-like enzyme [Paenibacillus harenae]
MVVDTNVVIKKAVPEDAAIILDLWQTSARWLLANGIKQWRPEHFHLEKVFKFMNDGSNMYLAEMNGVAVGTYVITWADPNIWQELDSKDAGYIHKFAVNRDYKGAGIGSYLIRCAEEQIRQSGRSLVRLDCMAANPRLNQYYLDLGFSYVRSIDGEGWSANLYEKK